MNEEIKKLSNLVVDKLIEKKIIVSTVESCTGGGLASSIIDTSGASNIINEAYVTYSNEAKIKNVGVDKNLINKYGVVSSEVAIDMANKLKEKTKCDIAISTTGNLGPNTLDNKAAGLVYIGYVFLKNTGSVECRFGGDRLEVKEKVIHKSLDILYNLINENSISSIVRG